MTDERIKLALDAYFDHPKISSATIMAQGKENTSVFVKGSFGRIVVRVWGTVHGYMGVRQQGDIMNELAFMQFCYDRHFPVPQIYTSKNNKIAEMFPDGAHYAVIGYVEGNSPQVFSPSMMRKIAMIMAELHNAVAGFAFPHKRSWPGTLIEMTSDRIKQFEAGTYDLADEPQEFLKRSITRYKKQLAQHEATLLSLPTGVIHGDIMWENIKFKDGKLEGIFDFDDCRKSYFLEDIVKTLLFEFESPAHCLFGDNGENVASFLDAYRLVRPLTEAEENILPLFFTARFIYQLIGYYAKVGKDKSYLGKAQQTVNRYKQNMAFFE